MDATNIDDVKGWCVALSTSSFSGQAQAKRISCLQRLAKLVRSQELRDLDEDGLFQAPWFNKAIGCLLPHAWKLLSILGNSRPLSGGSTKSGSSPSLPATGVHPSMLMKLGRTAGLPSKRKGGHVMTAFPGKGVPVSNTSSVPSVSAPSGDQAMSNVEYLELCYTVVLGVLGFPEFDPHAACPDKAWPAHNRPHHTPPSPTDTKSFNSVFVRAMLARYRSPITRSVVEVRVLGSSQSVMMVAPLQGDTPPTEQEHPPPFDPQVVADTKGSTSAVSSSSSSSSGSGGSSTVRPRKTQGFDEIACLKKLTHTAYDKFVPLRPLILSGIGAFFTQFLHHPLQFGGVRELLQVVGSIAKGMTVPIRPRFLDLLHRCLLPLHAPSDRVTDVTPVLEVYHQDLAYCISQFLQADLTASSSSTSSPVDQSDEKKASRPPSTVSSSMPSSASMPKRAPHPHAKPPRHSARSALSSMMKIGAKNRSLGSQVLRTLLTYLPSARTANSSKEVLLLHELDCFLKLIDQQTFLSISSLVYAAVLPAMASLNFRVAERALSMWRNDVFLKHATCTDQARANLYPQLIKVLCAEKSWNVTVNKMRGTVLELLGEIDRERFHQCLASHWNISPQKAEQKVGDLIAALRPVKEKPVEVATAATVPSPLVEVKYTDLVFGKVLGTGSFAEVRLAKQIVRGTSARQWPKFAVKTIDKRIMDVAQYKDSLAREIAIMQQLSHPNINKLVGVCQSSAFLYLILEYAAHGDLFTHLSQFGSLSEDSARFVIAEVVLGLEHMHSQGVLYLDLKPENILLHENWHIKLADFGCARKLHDEKQPEYKLEGTAEYLSPEVIQGQPPTPAADLWALGCLLYQLLVGRTPVWNDSPDAGQEAHKAVLEKVVKFSLASSMDAFPSHVSAEAQGLITSLLSTDPTQRPGAGAGGYTELKSHAFFNGIDWATIQSSAAPALSAGAVAPRPDANWARRKNSMMFSPMPLEYDFAGQDYSLPTIEQVAEEEAFVESQQKNLRTSVPVSGKAQAKQVVRTAVNTSAYFKPSSRVKSLQRAPRYPTPAS